MTYCVAIGWKFVADGKRKAWVIVDLAKKVALRAAFRYKALRRVSAVIGGSRLPPRAWFRPAARSADPFRSLHAGGAQAPRWPIRTRTRTSCPAAVADCSATAP